VATLVFACAARAAAPLASAASVSGADLSAPAGDAADAPDSSDGAFSQIESVTVSARRVAEDVQSVPIPIAVVSGSALENAGQFRLEDLNQ
ncbi:hypothetical protein, partial [Enterococcus faecium]|uniref:hypothetical protein n=1 Tax=Enterococcus faecium TaxID=1352 RepID=UPI003F435B0A